MTRPEGADYHAGHADGAAARDEYWRELAERAGSDDVWTWHEPDRAATDVTESDIAAERALAIAEAEAESSHIAWLEAQRADDGLADVDE